MFRKTSYYAFEVGSSVREHLETKKSKKVEITIATSQFDFIGYGLPGHLKVNERNQLIFAL